MPRHRFANVLRPLFHTLVVGVAERGTLVPVQQRVRLRHVGDIACRADDRVHQARSSIDADVGLHAKVCQSLPFFDWCISGSRLPSLFFVDGGAAISVASTMAFAHYQALLGEVSVDRVEDLARQPFGFKQVAELQQGRRVRRRLAAQINTDKGANRLAVVDRVFDAFVRQTKALLGHVHAQHTSEPDRWPTGAFDLRIERFDGLMQLTPRGHAVDLSEEAVAPRQLLLGGVFKVGKALLRGRWRTVGMPLLSQVGLLQGTASDELISASLEPV